MARFSLFGPKTAAPGSDGSELGRWGRSLRPEITFRSIVEWIHQRASARNERGTVSRNESWSVPAQPILVCACHCSLSPIAATNYGRYKPLFLTPADRGGKCPDTQPPYPTQLTSKPHYTPDPLHPLSQGLMSTQPCDVGVAPPIGKLTIDRPVGIDQRFDD